jgi:hypothetical protein
MLPAGHGKQGADPSGRSWGRGGMAYMSAVFVQCMQCN